MGLDIIKRWSETGLWISADLGNDDQDKNPLASGQELTKKMFS